MGWTGNVVVTVADERMSLGALGCCTKASAVYTKFSRLADIPVGSFTLVHRGQILLDEEEKLCNTVWRNPSGSSSLQLKAIVDVGAWKDKLTVVTPAGNELLLEVGGICSQTAVICAFTLLACVFCS